MGYSFGGSVAWEIGNQLEKNGEKVNVIFLDGSPSYITEHIGAYKSRKNNVSVDDFESAVGAYLRFITLFVDFDYNKVRFYSIFI